MKIRIAQISDTHLGLTKMKSLHKMFKQMAKEHFDILLHCGDYGNTGYRSVRSTTKAIREILGDVPFVSTIGNHCLTDDCEILTESGWKNIDTINESDVVATMNTEKILKWKPINSIIRRELNSGEYIYDYDSTKMSIGVTNKHRLYTYNRFNKKIIVREAKDCPKDFCVINAINTDTDIHLTDDELRLSAWLCTDSHFNKYGKIILYQRESNVGKIFELLDRLNIEYTFRKRDRKITHIQGKLLKSIEPGYEIYFNMEVSRTISKRTLTYSNKSLPEWYKSMSTSQWEIFMEVQGAGKVFYGKKRICEDVQIGAVLHGYRASLKEYRENQWKVNLSAQKITRIINFPESKKRNYEGKVWCINVDNNNFVTRRNNKVYITGNCYWHTGKKYVDNRCFQNLRPSLYDFTRNYEKIVEAFKSTGVHFLDRDGPYRDSRFPGFAIVGHTGWYSAGREIYKISNDFNRLPSAIEGDTHLYLQKRASTELYENIDKLTMEDKHIIFASHFPVIYEEKYNHFYWHKYISDMMQVTYDCNYFFNGHAHQKHSGPLRYECGSDYFKPAYQIVEVEF